MILLLLGIILGWFIPRPAVIGRIESKLLGPIKSHVPDYLKWWI